jgi:hypothetical protein
MLKQSDDDRPYQPLASLIRQTAVRVARHPDRSLEGLRGLRRTLSRELRPRSGDEVLSLAEALIDCGCARWLVYELAHHHPGAMAAVSPQNLNRLGRDLTSWGEVDAFGCYLLGPAWREGRVPDVEIASWAKSSDRWRRRSALVATVALNVPARGGLGDAGRTLMVCDLLIDDRDDMVVKAMSWALRALATQNPAAVRGYMKKREGRLAARILREVRNKLETGLKNPKSKNKAATKKNPKKQ